MKKNLLLTFGFAFIPGAGQMYQNYMKRGLSIMILAGAVLALTSFLRFSIFVVPFLIIVAYSFFDTFNLRNMTDEKRKEYEDEYVWYTEEFKKVLNNKQIRAFKGSKTLGIILVVCGIYYIVDGVLLTLLFDIGLYNTANFLNGYLRPAFIAICSIYIGLKMMNAKK